MDTTVAHEELIRGHKRLEGKNVLLDLAVINLSASIDLDKEVERPGAFITAAVERTLTGCRDTLSATYVLLSGPWAHMLKP